MSWVLTESDTANGLSDVELVSMIVLLTASLTEPFNDSDPLYRAWAKLQPAFEACMNKPWGNQEDIAEADSILAKALEVPSDGSNN